MKLWCKGGIVHILRSNTTTPITAARTCFTDIRDLVSYSSSEARTLYFSHVPDLKMQCRMTNIKLCSVSTLRAAVPWGVLRELVQEVASSLETLTGEHKPDSTEILNCDISNKSHMAEGEFS